MQENTPWLGRRYYPVSHYFQSRLGSKVAKISVSVADRCPSRSDGCIFCDEWGSAAYPKERERELAEQIRHNREIVARRMKDCRFLVYFQSYTNTLDKVAVLRQRFETALAQPDICGIVVGTRPDCLPERIFALLDEVSRSHYLMVELGVQSFNNDDLAFLKRGHSAERSIEAVHELAAKTSADIGIHLIFGLPGETPEKIIATAEQVNRLPVNNVKLHNLHVLKNTELAEIYQRGEFVPDELPEYAEKVILFLRHLSPEISVQRLAALASRWEELIAPAWTRQKMQPMDYIEGLMRERGMLQGDLYRSGQ
jgi:radical SAM protein (TIGR01212 family)